MCQNRSEQTDRFFSSWRWLLHTICKGSYYVRLKTYYTENMAEKGGKANRLSYCARSGPPSAYFLAIFCHLDNNWAIWEPEKVIWLCIFEKPETKLAQDSVFWTFGLLSFFENLTFIFFSIFGLIFWLFQSPTFCSINEKQN